VATAPLVRHGAVPHLLVVGPATTFPYSAGKDRVCLGNKAKGLDEHF
jgi:hypothetical protein